MNDYKYFLIACCITITVCLLGGAYSDHLKSAQKEKELEIKKLELLIKLKKK